MNQTSDVRAMMDAVNSEASNMMPRKDRYGVSYTSTDMQSQYTGLSILADALEEAGNDTLAVRLRMVAEAGFWPRCDRLGWWRWYETPTGSDTTSTYSCPPRAVDLLEAAKGAGKIEYAYMNFTAAEALVALATALSLVSESDALAALQPDRSTVS